MKKDTIFNEASFAPGDFSFNKNVVEVFDDMISRSVPFYNYLLQAIVFSLFRLLKDSKKLAVYDLGASTGALMQVLQQYCYGAKQVDYYAVDSSLDMLAVLNENRYLYDLGKVVTIEHDLNKFFKFGQVDVVVLNLILQFLTVESRLPLLKNIFESLSPGGVCFFVEKCVQQDDFIQDLFVQNYHQYKLKQGYSVDEIKNKDIALSGVLNPLFVQDNVDLLKDAGFTAVYPFYQWFNFIGLIAIK